MRKHNKEINEKIPHYNNTNTNNNNIFCLLLGYTCDCKISQSHTLGYLNDMSRNWKHPLSSPDGISVTDYQQYERYDVRSASMENRFSVSLARVRTRLLYRMLFSYDFMWTFFGSMPALVNAHRRVNLLVVGYRIRATSQKSLPFKVTFLSNLLLVKTYSSMSLHLVTVELLIKSIWGLPRACGFHRNDPHSCSVDLKGTSTT